MKFSIGTDSFQKNKKKKLVSLAQAARFIICNAFFAPRGSPLYRLYKYVTRQRVFFLKPFWSEIGYQFRPFWSETGYGLCLLVLNWVCFFKELATSSSFGDKAISLLMFVPTTVYMPQQLVMRSGHMPGSRTSGLK